MFIKTKILILSGIVIVLLSGILTFKINEYINVKNDKLLQLKENLDSYKETLLKTRNELGQEIAQKNIISNENVKLLRHLKSQDSTIIKVQNELKNKNVKKPGDNISYVEIITEIPIIKTEFKYDTIIQNKIVIIDTTFKFNDKWYVLEGYIKDNNITLDSISITNDLFISQYSRKDGLFKRTEIVEVKLLNPYSSTKNIYSYRVKNNDTRFGVGLQLGLGLNLDSFNFNPYIGVGIHYTLFKF